MCSQAWWNDWLTDQLIKDKEDKSSFASKMSNMLGQFLCVCIAVGTHFCLGPPTYF